MSEAAELRAQIAALQRKLNTPMPEAERNEIAAAQARADAVAVKFGLPGATQPIPGETGIQFRKRLLGTFKKYSPEYKSANVEMIGDPAVLKAAEETIYKDAAAAALDSSSYPPNTLRPIRERDESGRMVTRYVGDNMAWMRLFCLPSRVGRFVEPTGRRGGAQ
ncbi:MAG TPA: hypothetical protein VMB73_25535 [Acetobacteraceae bacterium]|nr:hypothetical protein [Acetobacteraceae bacterium]